MNVEDSRTAGFVALVLGVGMVFAIGGFVVGYESGYNEAVEVCKEKLDRLYRGSAEHTLPLLNEAADTNSILVSTTGICTCVEVQSAR